MLFLRGDGGQTFNRLHAQLQHHITEPEHTVRWQWQPGEVVMWDDRATQHDAVNDDGDAARKVQRVSIARDVPVPVPVPVDRRRSVPVEGDAPGYSALAS